MDLVNEYNKLCQRIWELRIGFYQQYKIEPNTVNMGHDEFYALKNGNNFLVENGAKNNTEDYTVFGMNIKTVSQNTHLSVGYMVE